MNFSAVSSLVYLCIMRAKGYAFTDREKGLSMAGLKGFQRVDYTDNQKVDLIMTADCGS